MKIKVHHPEEIINGVRLYAEVQSRTVRGLEYRVVHIRTATENYWTCTCDDFVLRRQGQNRHCDHIREVRAQVE